MAAGRPSTSATEANISTGKVWELVAESLQKAGYPLPQKGPRSPGKQCDDKWRQLKAQYYKHKNPKTGEGAKTPLPYYDLVDSIIGGDQLTSPKHIRDTLNSSNNSRSSETAAAPSPSNSVEQPQQNLFGDSDSEEDADTPPDPQTTAEVDHAGSSNSNIHKGRGKKRLKPVTGNQRVMIEMMEKKAKMIEKLAENRLKVLQDMHKEDNETTRQLIDVMKEALKSKIVLRVKRRIISLLKMSFAHWKARRGKC
ncbi:uncharacterized protein [Bemisia tabaci]|uniref:uncharacterized protein n=1 Tax=Bemisia tabaci TaxID=7038 RepID=UPI003B281E43